MANYIVKRNPKSTKIIFEKDCQIDYEDCWTLLVDALTECEFVRTTSGKHADIVEFDKKVIIEIKTQNHDNR